MISSKISQNNQYLYISEVESIFGQGELREPFGSLTSYHGYLGS